MLELGRICGARRCQASRSSVCDKMEVCGASWFLTDTRRHDNTIITAAAWYGQTIHVTIALRY